MLRVATDLEEEGAWEGGPLTHLLRRPRAEMNPAERWRRYFIQKSATAHPPSGCKTASG